MNRPLRIALVSEHYKPRVGGIEMHVQTLAHHLNAAGHDVHIITTYPGAEVVDGVRIHRFEVPLLPIWKSAFTPAGIAPVRRLLERERFDVVHAHVSVYSPATLAVLYIAQQLQLPSIATFHSQLSGYTQAYRLMDRVCGWTQWNVVYTAVSENIAASISALTDRRTVPVLANGIDAARWRIDPQAGDPGVIRIVTTMRLAPRKRPRALIDTFAAARARLSGGPDLKLLVIGDGPERAAVEANIRKRGMTAHVTLAGALRHDAIRAAYQSSDVFVLPSIQEAFGIAALEARAAGLPVITMAASGAASFISHEANGLLAETDGDFVAAVVRLARDGELRRRISGNNRTAPVPYSWESVLADHMEIYDRATVIAPAESVVTI